MKKAKLLSLVGVLLLVLFAVSACGGEGGEAQETIKIGVNYELSGEVASFGSHTVNGIQLAFEEINAAGGVLGKQIEPIVLDNKGVAEEATSVATNLIVNQGAVVHLGAATTGATLAAIPVAMESKVPLLTTSATALPVTVDPLTGETRDYVFRICFIDPWQGEVGARFAYQDLGVRKAAVYFDNTNDYSKGLAQSFMDEFETLGGQIVGSEGYGTGDQEFRPTLNNFKNSGAELIYIPGYYQKVGLIVRQAREIGLDVPLLGGDGWDAPELIEVAGAENLNNAYFTNHYSFQDPAEKVQAFVEAYQAKYGEIPDSFSALGYDAAYLIADAINRAGVAEPEAIKDALAATTDFDAVTGKLSFDEQHNPVKEIAIIELVNGEQKLITKIAPE